MLTLINSNRMSPPIAPLGLDYVGAALRRAGIEVELLDLCLARDADEALRRYFATRQPELIGISFRNIDDCFWPSGVSFVPELTRLVAALRGLTDAPLVLGGVGYSILATELLHGTGADFGIRGDGEQALVELFAELRGTRRWDRVGGLLWQDNGAVRANAPAWPERLAVPPDRDLVDNATFSPSAGRSASRRSAAATAIAATASIRWPKARTSACGQLPMWPMRWKPCSARASTCSTSVTPSSTCRPAMP